MTESRGGAAPRGLATPDRLDIPFADPLVERLFPPLATGVEWGLDRTRSALSDLGDPHTRYPTVHVGGTNGKGSVASTIHSVLEAEGLRSGLYTSPHLCFFPERYAIGGGPVSEVRLVDAARDIRAVVVERGLTFFEAITVLAFHLFAEMEAEVVVVEVGLGGRLDATNVIRPVCAAITNVAMDHAEYLGGTLASVAREKAGIIKSGVPVLTAERDPALVGIFREIAEGRGAPLTALHPERDLHDVEVDRDHTAFTWRSRAWGPLRLETPLVGRHQAVNAALAVEALEHLPETLRPDADAVRRGVAAVRWPGRDQVETIDGGTWLFDVAHNVAGMESLVDTLDRLDLPSPRIALVGVLGDKDWRSMLPPLLERCASAVFTVPPTAPAGRTWDPAEAAGALRIPSGAAPCPIRIEPDFPVALERARDAAGAGTVVVTGSVHTVGNALRILGRVPWEDGPA